MVQASEAKACAHKIKVNCADVQIIENGEKKGIIETSCCGWEIETREDPKVWSTQRFFSGWLLSDTPNHCNNTYLYNKLP